MLVPQAHITITALTTTSISSRELWDRTACLSTTPSSERIHPSSAQRRTRTATMCPIRSTLRTASSTSTPAVRTDVPAHLPTISGLAEHSIWRPLWLLTRNTSPAHPSLPTFPAILPTPTSKLWLRVQGRRAMDLYLCHCFVRQYPAVSPCLHP